MIVREVHTAFEHEVNGKKHVGSFLYLEEVSKGDIEELTRGHHTKIVDPLSLAYLEEKQGFDVLAWFLSMDGNFLVLRDLSMVWEVRQVNTHTIVKLQWQIEGDLMGILRQLREELHQNPTSARKILRNSSPSRGRLPKRITFADMNHMGIEEIRTRLEKFDPASASDDLLAFAVIRGKTRDRWGKEILEECKRECQRRYKNFGRNEPGIFDLSKVSLAELEARYERGRDTLWKFNNRFPAVGCLESRIVAHDEWDWQVLEFLRKLSDDVLAELLLAFFADGVELSARSKHLYFAATQRQNPRIDY